MVDSPHKWPIVQRAFPCQDPIIICQHMSWFNPSKLKNGDDFGFRFYFVFLPLTPSGLPFWMDWRAGVWSETAGNRFFSIRSSMELTRPVVVQSHGHLPFCTIWAKNSNLVPVRSRLWGTHISETIGQISSIWGYMELPFAPYQLSHEPKNLSIPLPVGSTLWGTHIIERAGQIFSIRSSMGLSRVDVDNLM